MKHLNLDFAFIKNIQAWHNSGGLIDPISTVHYLFFERVFIGIFKWKINCKPIAHKSISIGKNNFDIILCFFQIFFLQPDGMTLISKLSLFQGYTIHSHMHYAVSSKVYLKISFVSQLSMALYLNFHDSLICGAFVDVQNHLIRQLIY